MGLLDSHFPDLTWWPGSWDTYRAECECGWVSPWMVSQPGAQVEADRHHETGGGNRHKRGERWSSSR